MKRTHLDFFEFGDEVLAECMNTTLSLLCQFDTFALVCGDPGLCVLVLSGEGGIDGFSLVGSPLTVEDARVRLLRERERDGHREEGIQRGRSDRVG